MKYLHTLDPDEIRDLFDNTDEIRDLFDNTDDDYWVTVAELAAEDAAMEKYYNRKYNNQ